MHNRVLLLLLVLTYLLYGLVEHLCADACAGALNALQLCVNVIDGGLTTDEALKVLLHLQAGNNTTEYISDIAVA